MRLDKKEKHIFWLMGPTSSGKTTLAKLLHGRLLNVNNFALHYDGDEVRNFFGPHLGLLYGKFDILRNLPNQNHEFVENELPNTTLNNNIKYIFSLSNYYSNITRTVEIKKSLS